MQGGGRPLRVRLGRLIVDRHHLHDLETAIADRDTAAGHGEEIQASRKGDPQQVAVDGIGTQQQTHPGAADVG